MKHRDPVEIGVGIFLGVLGLLVVLLLVGMFVMGGYCAFGDVMDPHYQYLCGHSVDIK